MNNTYLPIGISGRKIFFVPKERTSGINNCYVNTDADENIDKAVNTYKDINSYKDVNAYKDINTEINTYTNTYTNTDAKCSILL